MDANLEIAKSILDHIQRGVSTADALEKASNVFHKSIHSVRYIYYKYKAKIEIPGLLPSGNNYLSSEQKNEIKAIIIALSSLCLAITPKELETFISENYGVKFSNNYIYEFTKTLGLPLKRIRGKPIAKKRFISSIDDVSTFCDVR